MAHPSGSTSLSPKAQHYNVSLTSALLKGCWGDNVAGTAPNGTELSWGELVRKWGKHTGGNTELIHRLRDISLLYYSNNSTSSSGFITVPPPPQAGVPANASNTAGTHMANTSPGAPNGSNSSDETGTTASASSFIHVPHPHLRRHRSRLSNEVGPGARGMSPAAAPGSRAAYLSTGDLDGDDAPDGSGWAAGGWSIGISSEGVEEAREGVKALEGLISGGKLTPGELQSAKTTLGFYHHALGNHEDALWVLEDVQGDPKVGAVEGDAAVLERIRARCIQGMSTELRHNSVPEQAIRIYTSIIPLVSSLTTLAPATPSYLLSNTPSGSTRQPFDSHREVYRYLSTALCRAAILSARTPNAHRETLRILRSYHAFSASCPSSFRPLQRQRMLQLYLRALHVGYPPANTAPDSQYTLDTALQSPKSPARTLWQNEAVEAIRLGKSLLSATTTFPRAGVINSPVRQFANLCVALADRCLTIQREVINVLWWAMTLTFQSQAILRHLTRLQAAQGDSVGARRTFELYVQIVLKARETQQPEASLQLKRRSAEDRPTSPAQIAQEFGETTIGDEAEDKRADLGETEVDTDDEFIGCLLVGAKLLWDDVGDADEAWRYLTLAGDVVEAADKGRKRIKQSLRGEVEEYKGIARMAMAMRGADPSIRPTYQAQAIDYLKVATQLNPSSASAYYNLALCQAQARSIEAASESIRRSLELDSRNVQAWHLLALLLTAQKDWEDASKAGEAGISVWEQDEENEVSDEEIVSGSSDDPNIASRDFASATHPVAVEMNNEPLLLPSGNFHPPHIGSQPPSSALSRAKRLENVISLRMTMNVVAEKILGQEVAMLRQQELFAFFSGRSGKNRGLHGGVGTRGLVGSQSYSSVQNARDDLGGSYISVSVDRAAAADTSANDGGVISVIPPTPSIETPDTSAYAARPLGQPIGGVAHAMGQHSARSSPGGSSATSDADSPDERGEKGQHKEKKLGATKRLVARHLHVPHNGSGRSSRPSSVRRLPVAEDTAGPAVQRHRAGSASSTALSIAPTAVRSHFHGNTPAPPPPPPPTQPKPPSEHTPAELRILSNLWLMSAATFRRWAKPDQSLVAIEEAEVLDPENADVWVQLGLYYSAQHPPNYPAALSAFTKALLLRSDYAPSLVHLAKVYLATDQVELAHSLLNQMTQDSGWDVSEAWFYLGKVCERQGRMERARECWRYALELEETRPARRWDVC